MGEDGGAAWAQLGQTLSDTDEAGSDHESSFSFAVISFVKMIKSQIKQEFTGCRRTSRRKADRQMPKSL